MPFALSAFRDLDALLALVAQRQRLALSCSNPPFQLPAFIGIGRMLHSVFEPRPTLPTTTALSGFTVIRLDLPDPPPGKFGEILRRPFARGTPFLVRGMP
jgi:hypothetical protein